MGMLQKLLKQTVTFERKGARTFDRGVAVQAAATQMTAKGSVQPERNLALIRETFGSHVEGALKVYTYDRLRTKESDGGADVILYDGRRWEVSEVRHYDELLPHYKSIAILVKDEH